MEENEIAYGVMDGIFEKFTHHGPIISLATGIALSDFDLTCGGCRGRGRVSGGWGLGTWGLGIGDWGLGIGDIESRPATVRPATCFSYTTRINGHTGNQTSVQRIRAHADFVGYSFANTLLWSTIYVSVRVQIHYNQQPEERASRCNNSTFIVKLRAFLIKSPSHTQSPDCCRCLLSCHEIFAL